MRTKMLKGVKFVVCVESTNRPRIDMVSVFDNRTGQFWTDAMIHDRGIKRFLDMADMSESLNWNLNGDGAKYQFHWVSSNDGVAYIFD